MKKDLSDAYEDFKDLAQEQLYEYDSTNPADEVLPRKGHVMIDINGTNGLGITFAGTPDAQLKALLTSGLFSYEVVGTNLILTFGNDNIKKSDGITLKYPEETLTINNEQRPAISFTGTTLEFTSSNLNSFVLDASTMVDDTNKDSTYFIRGSSAATNDKADFSALTSNTDKIVLSLETRTGTIGAVVNKVAVGNIEHITGGSADDTLTGDSGVNTLRGGEGADTLEGRAGADFLYGDGGTDTASYKSSDDAVQVDLTNAGQQASTGDAEDDTLDSIENLIGSDNTATGDMLTGDGEANRIEGGDGGDTLRGGANGDFLYGDAGNDRLEGGAGVDELYGGEGDDILEGGADADTLDGGDHNSGAGAIGDTASYKKSLNAVTVNLSDGLTETGGDAEGDTLLNIENIIGSDHADTLTGNDQANRLDGGAGVDTVSYKNSLNAVQVNLGTGTGTGDGSDTLLNIENIIGSDDIVTGDTLTGDLNANRIEGGLGGDTLTGGMGADTYVYHYINTAAGRKDGIDTIAEVDKGNIIELYFEDSSATWGEGDTHVYFETYDDDNVRLVFRPDPLMPEDIDPAHYIVLSRTDILDERFTLKAYTKGSVEITTGNFPVDAGALTTAYNTFKSKETPQPYIYSSADPTVTLTDLGPVTITLDSSLGIAFSGTDFDAKLKALLTSGRFSYEVDAGTSITLTFGGVEGIDKKTLTIDYPLPESITFVDSGGEELVFSPDSGKVFLTDADLLTLRTHTNNNYKVTDANKGNTYLIAGTVDGTSDTADFSALSDTVVLSLETGTGTLDGEDIAVGNIEHIKGGSVADTLKGDSGDNTLIGLSGNDQLFGGDGVDILRGGADNDILEGGAGTGDTLDGGGGIDTASYASSEDKEGDGTGVTVNLATLGASGDDATGDSLSSIENITGSIFNDKLTGNRKANTLKGGDGKDTLLGGLGDDTLEGGEGGTSGIGNSEQLTGGLGADTYVYYYTTSRQDGIDTITEEADTGNTIKIYVTDDSMPAWGVGGLVYFFTHTDDLDTQVRLVFRLNPLDDFDTAHYITLTSQDLLDGKFKLEIYSEADNAEVTNTPFLVPAGLTPAAAFGEEYKQFTIKKFDYDLSASTRDFTGTGDVEITLANTFFVAPALDTNDNDAQLKALLASGRFSYEERGGNIILIFGDDITYPLKEVELSNPPNKVTFKLQDVDGNDVEPPAYSDSSNLLPKLEKYAVIAPGGTGTYEASSDTYLVQGSDGTSDTADFSGLSDEVDLSLLTGTGMLGSHAIAVIDIENIRGGSATTSSRATAGRTPLKDSAATTF